MFAKTVLPSSTAIEMVAKLSSANTIEAASLAASDPATPIATPICAYYSAGASFTPSPVIATTYPYSPNTNQSAHKSFIIQTKNSRIH
jgi:hypothetical protein